MINMARALTLSLRRNGGVYANAPVILTVGDEKVDPSLPASLPWLKPLGIEWRWLAEAQFAVDTFWSNAALRYEQSFRSDMALMLDADILIASPFDEMVRSAHRKNAVAGLIAYSSPFEVSPLEIAPMAGDWHELYRSFGLPHPRLQFTHTGFGTLHANPRFARCPAYFNQGVICLPTPIASRMGRLIPDYMAKLKARTNSPFRLQLAITLAIASLRAATLPLPLRYNFANHECLEVQHGRALPGASLLHLHGAMPVSKMELFASLQSMQEFTARADLKGINAAAQKVLTEILPQLS